MGYNLKTDKKGINMTDFIPYADESSVLTLGEFTAENRTESH